MKPGDQRKGEKGVRCGKERKERNEDDKREENLRLEDNVGQERSGLESKGQKTS